MSLRARVRVDFPGYALDADLALPEHGISAVFGPSGAGKSTLLRAVAGLERTHGSRIEVAGETWQDDERALFLPSHKRPLGFVFQHTHLFAHLDVRRNLEFGMRRVPAGERRIPLAQAVGLLDIGHLLARRPDTLSGGERQRVGIARALATSPRVLLLDEPLSALDMGLKAEIMPYLERLNRELRLPMLYVSHALDEVARLADWLVLLDAGRVAAAGPTAELLTRLDLPLAHGDAAAAVIEGEVVELDPEFRLATVAFCGERIQLADEGVSLGQRVRLRVQARDVSLTLERQSGTSILNSIEVAVAGIADEGRSQAMVALDAGGARLLSRITRKSAAALELRPGMRLFAQVKGVAVIG